MVCADVAQRLLPPHPHPTPPHTHLPTHQTTNQRDPHPPPPPALPTHATLVAQTARYPTSISSLAFSRSGELLAVASSYAHEQGEQPGQPPDALYIRPVADAEVRPKQRKA